MSERRLAPMRSWREFLAAARAPASIPFGLGRGCDAVWAGGTWEEAVRLAVDGWPQELPSVEVTVGELAATAGMTSAVVLRPAWDVTGSEVDIGAYLSGAPECMVDAVPQRTSTRGRVVTFLVPAGYANTVPHAAIRNRGLALAALCAAIIGAGHSVDIWSGDAGMLDPFGRVRYSAVARVIAPGEPLDLGRLMFALAHPAMCRRLWLAVWDGQERDLAGRMFAASYGHGPYACVPGDLPEEVGAPYVLPYLDERETRWNTAESALAWTRETFAELGLVD